MSDEHEGATLLACSMAALLVSCDGAPYLLTRPDMRYLLVPILDTKTNIGDTATSTRLTMEELVRLVNGGALVLYHRKQIDHSLSLIRLVLVSLALVYSTLEIHLRSMVLPRSKTCLCLVWLHLLPTSHSLVCHMTL